MSAALSASAAENDRIAEVLRRLAAAWNAGDGTAFGAVFAADATYVTFAGTVLRGRRAIGETHQFLFDGPLRGSRMPESGGPMEIRFLTGDVAHVLVDGGVRLDGQEELPSDRASTVSFVLRRSAADRWEIEAFQNTRNTGTGR